MNENERKAELFDLLTTGFEDEFRNKDADLNNFVKEIKSSLAVDNSARNVLIKLLGEIK